MAKLDSNGAEACKLTPCGTPLRAASGRSQASALLFVVGPNGDLIAARQASELIGCAVPQGGPPAQPAALGPAGGPVATRVQVRKFARTPWVRSLLLLIHQP
jgi:hypothetical protein